MIGKHELVAVLQRLHSRDPVLSTVEFDSVLGRENQYMFGARNDLPVRFLTIHL